MPDFWSQFEEEKVTDEVSPTEEKQTVDFWEQFPAEEKQPEKEKSFTERLNVSGSLDTLISALSDMFTASKAGIHQGLAESAVSATNLPLSATGQQQVPYPDLMKDVPDDIMSQLLAKGFKFGTEGVVGGKLFKGLQGLGRGASLAKDIGAGATTGAVLGGSDDPDQDLISRVIASVLGGGLAGKIGTSRSKVGERVLEKQSETKEALGKAYKDVFGKVKDAGLSNEKLRIPSKFMEEEVEEVSRNFPAHLKRSVAAFKRNPTFEEAHNLQSDLGKYYNKVNKVINRGAGDTQDIKTSKLLQDLQQRVRGEMQQFLTKNKQEGILKDYNTATQRYKTELEPFREKPFAKYATGEISKEKLVDELMKIARSKDAKKLYSDIAGFDTRKFMQDISENKALRNIAKAGLGATGLYGLSKGIKRLSGAGDVLGD